jgi:hypothetical protein
MSAHFVRGSISSAAIPSTPSMRVSKDDEPTGVLPPPLLMVAQVCRLR